MSYGTSNSDKSAWPDKPMEIEDLKKAMQEASEKINDLNIPDVYLLTNKDYQFVKAAIEAHGVSSEVIKLSDSIMFGIPFETWPDEDHVLARSIVLRAEGKKVCVIEMGGENGTVSTRE
jgi:hypothetical protein